MNHLPFKDMNKNVASLIALFFVITCFNLTILAQINAVEGINFNRNEVIIPCPPDNPSPFNCSGNTVIKVKTKIISLNNKLKFHYSVSGGRIIGQGANVNWDLSGVKSGVYSITVIVKNKNGHRKSFTKKINAKKCLNCGISDECDCPVLSIVGSQQIQLEKDADFVLNTSGDSQNYLTYNWQISSGEIVSGQGTPSITINTKNSTEDFITVMVEVSGICSVCQKSVAKKVKLVSKL